MFFFSTFECNACIIIKTGFHEGEFFAEDLILRRKRKYMFGVCEHVPRGSVVRLRQAAVCWAAACVCVCMCVVVRPLCAVCATSAGNGDGPVSSLNAANVC